MDGRTDDLRRQYRALHYVHRAVKSYLNAANCVAVQWVCPPFAAFNLNCFLALISRLTSIAASRSEAAVTNDCYWSPLNAAAQYQQLLLALRLLPMLPHSAALSAYNVEMLLTNWLHSLWSDRYMVGVIPILNSLRLDKGRDKSDVLIEPLRLAYKGLIRR